MIYRLLFTSFAVICDVLTSMATMNSIKHFKCRGGKYPFTEISRVVFSDVLVAWTAKYESYNPPQYNSPALKNKPWADPDIGG